MALPQLIVPKHKVKLHSLNKEITYRPFLVKEEKILLIALESRDTPTIIDAIKQIIRNCVESKPFDVDKLPLFDIEYLFLQLRRSSVGDVVKIRILCQEPKAGGVCGLPIDQSIDLKEVKLYVPPEHVNKIMLTDTIGVVLRYPTINIAQQYLLLDEMKENISNIFPIFLKLIDHIFDDKQVYKTGDYTEEELSAFFDSLTQAQFEQFQNFFITIPTLHHEFTYTCTCSTSPKRMVLTTLDDFFTLV